MESEQFSLCWNNFHNNLSSGFNSLLQDEDLVDVTLAAEGKYLKAHKAVLSVCSSYFKELFRVNPCKHPIVILQGVNYEALKNLLQFMYQGEVSVTQDEIPAFMKVAETLKVKGLTENAADKNRVERNNHNNSLAQPEAKPHMMGRRTVKKLIKPIQHLRPLEEPLVLHNSPPPPPLSSLQPPPAKKPNLGNSPPPATELPTEQQSQQHNNIETKEEPLDVADDAVMESRYEQESTDLKPVINTRLQEASSSQVASNWMGADVKMDQCSPGGFVFLKSRKGHPVLIHNGHMYTLHNKQDGRCTWICVKQQTLRCDGCIITANGSILLSYCGHNHPQLNHIIQRLQMSSCSPSPELP